MPNLVESTRNKILRGPFLLQDELTQEQYELVTAPELNQKKLFALHDSLFGGNLSKVGRNNIDTGPYTAPDMSPDTIDENPTDSDADSIEPAPSLC